MSEEPKTVPLQGDNGSPAPSQSAPAEPATAEATKKLTPEEQMALYEEDLKETDWGHQPC